jgi:DNA helicase HerA-like ATPase
VPRGFLLERVPSGIVYQYSTPYYLLLHTGDLAHTLILGMSGSGKAFLRRFAPQVLPAKQMELPLPA